LGTKSRLEAEYAKIPITVSGKGIAIKKRKEELEHELDQIEKVIYRARCCSANGGNSSQVAAIVNGFNQGGAKQIF
jgi:hypothetical protein